MASPSYLLGPLPLDHRKSPIKFERKLEYPRIVGSVPRCGDLSKGGGVDKAGDGRHRKVRRVGYVEDFGAKLKVRGFGGLEFLKKGEVKAVESRPEDLRRSAAQRRIVGLSDRRGDRRIGKRSRIHPFVDVMTSADRILSRHEQGVAAKISRRRIRTRNSHKACKT